MPADLAQQVPFDQRVQRGGGRQRIQFGRGGDGGHVETGADHRDRLEDEPLDRRQPAHLDRHRAVQGRAHRFVGEVAATQRAENLRRGAGEQLQVQRVAAADLVQQPAPGRRLGG